MAPRPGKRRVEKSQQRANIDEINDDGLPNDAKGEATALKHDFNEDKDMTGSKSYSQIQPLSKGPFGGRAESDRAGRERSRYTKYSSTIHRCPDATNLAVRMAQWAARVTARDHYSNVTLSFVTRFPLSSRLCILIATCLAHKKCK